MSDRIFEAFLERQQADALALTEASDLLSVVPVGPAPAARYVLDFACKGLIERSPGVVHEVEGFAVGVWFPSDYLRVANPFRVVTWLGPREIWHPNVSMTLPIICIGRLVPGTSLVDIAYQVFEIITWNKVTMREDDALNPAACQWARAHQDRYPVDRRPLRRRGRQFDVVSAESSEGGHHHGN